MTITPRIVAICDEGPLDGQRFSVALDGETPGNVVTHAADEEVTYAPVAEVELADEHRDGFDGHDLVGAWVYRQEA